MELDLFAKDILRRFYSRKDEDGTPIEEPADVFIRVVDGIVPSDDERHDQLLDAMEKLAFIPSSPTLMNAGTELGQLSACFVLPLEDDLDAIYTTIKNAALVHKTGGGTGFSFSHIRPRGSVVQGTGGVASGPLSFMSVFNESTNTIKQGGKRRGANMGVLSVHHPDIEDFVTCKLDNVSYTNFNLSVAVTREFLRAATGKGKYGQADRLPNAPREEDTPSRFYYDQVDPHTQAIVRLVNARRVWDLIIKCAWEHGDPGLVFIDTINDCSPTVQDIESTNPCGEIPLLPYEACNLGAINLDKCIGEDGNFSYTRLAYYVDLAVYFLNRVIDVNKFPVKEIDVQTRKTRKIGLGIMGFGDLCYRLGIRYGSEKSVKLATSISKMMAAEAKLESERLYKNSTDRKAYDDFFSIEDLEAKEKLNSYYLAMDRAQKFYKQDDSCGIHEIDELWNRAFVVHREAPVYNLCRLTAAPTGTTGILAGVSNGIEPNYGLVYDRLVNGTEKYRVVNKHFLKYLQDLGYTKETISRFVDELYEKGSLQKCTWATDEMKQIFVCANDLTWQEHLAVMEAFQRYIDNSISKTVNLPYEATVDTVKQIYEVANEKYLKGVTIYRDGSRNLQVLTTGSSRNKNATECTSVSDKDTMLDTDLEKSQLSNCCSGHGNCSDRDRCSSHSSCCCSAQIKDPRVQMSTYPRQRDRVLTGRTVAIRTGCGKMYVTINSDDVGVCEIFVGAGSSGCTAQSEALCRMISVALRCGVAPAELIDQLRKVNCKTACNNPHSECTSCPDALGRILEMELSGLSEPILKHTCKIKSSNCATSSEPEETVLDSKSIQSENTANCPNCGAKLIFESGCRTCKSCGWSKCN